MTFAQHLKKLVNAAGGSAPSAELCGVTQQSINLWLRGTVVPNRATRTGVIQLLGQKKSPPAK